MKPNFTPVALILAIFLFSSPADTFAGDIAGQFCQQAGPLKEACCTCVAGNATCTTAGDNQILGAWTAVGCIPISEEGIATSILRVLVSTSGGIALLLMLYGALTISTSTSNPERLQTGQKILTAAIAGLFFSLFSVVLLHFIGIELLQLPGFSN